MKRFATDVQPGFMYIHDIDAATCPGPHEVAIALAIAEDTRGSMFARFCRKDVTGDRLRTDPDQLLPVGE